MHDERVHAVLSLSLPLSLFLRAQVARARAVQFYVYDVISAPENRCIRCIENARERERTIHVR